MTVIVYRHGIMAADSGAWRAEMLVSIEVKKIFRLKNGGLYAGSGRRAQVQAVLAWLDGGSRPEPDKDPQDFEALVVDPGGKVSRLDGTLILTEDPPMDFYTAGAHGEFLTGALAAGASAFQAVELAIRFCDGAGGKPQAKRLVGQP